MYSNKFIIIQIYAYENSFPKLTLHRTCTNDDDALHMVLKQNHTAHVQCMRAHAIDFYWNPFL